MSLIYYILSILAGIFATLQVGVNGQLREKLGNPILSGLISFFVGTIGLALIFCILLAKGTYSLPESNALKGLRLWMFTGGLLGALYVLVTIVASPKIGFANMFSLVICGQILLAVIFDHFGLLGAQVHLLNPVRAIGVVLLIIGVYIIQTH